MRFDGQFSPSSFSAFDVSAPANLFWAELGVSLVQRAEAVSQRVFELRKISRGSARDAHLSAIWEAIDWHTVNPREDWVLDLSIRQGKQAIDKQLNQHGDVALRQAVYVAYCWQTRVMPLTAPGMADLASTVNDPLLTMITSLEHANRHLAMLEGLRNLEQNHYSIRASKGGYAKNTSLSKLERERLLRAMVKGMVANDVRFKNSNLTENADALARRILTANGEYQFLEIDSVEDLQAEVRTYLYEWIQRDKRDHDPRRASKDFITHCMRHPFPKLDDVQGQRMQTEAAQTRGRLEGQGLMLAILLQQRFDELPDRVLQVLSEADGATLQAWGLKLQDATCLEDVMGEWLA